MMGDDMAIRSGGMYGRPESQYTLATPASGFDSGAFGKVNNFASTLLNIYASKKQMDYARKQSRLDLEALYKERDYNVSNFKQQMADTLAQNKMSFYASGLDYKYGTAQNVIGSNQIALQNDLEMMKYNYSVEERNIKNKLRAAEKRHIGNVVGSAINYATSLAF